MAKKNKIEMSLSSSFPPPENSFVYFHKEGEANAQFCVFNIGGSIVVRDLVSGSSFPLPAERESLWDISFA